MAGGFLSPKILRADVTEGVDIERGVFLDGERITIGSGPGDDLRLGAAGIAPGHLTFTRREGKGGWEYFTSDTGETLVDRGNPRTGAVRAGMWFRLGPETRIDIARVPLPDSMKAAPGAGEKTEVPLTVALPLMALMLAGFGFYLTSIGRDDAGGGATLATAGYFVGSVPLEPALDTCLEAATAGGAAPLRVPASSPDALFRSYLAAPSDAIRSELTERVRGLVAEAHLLAYEGRFGDASDRLRRIEHVLPIDRGACPVLSAARADLALLELRARR